MTHEPPAPEQTIDEIVVRLQAAISLATRADIRDAVTQAYDELKDAQGA